MYCQNLFLLLDMSSAANPSSLLISETQRDYETELLDHIRPWGPNDDLMRETLIRGCIETGFTHALTMLIDKDRYITNNPYIANMRIPEFGTPLGLVIQHRRPLNFIQFCSTIMLTQTYHTILSIPR